MDNYENSLFKTANKLRGKIPPSDYKFYVLPLVYIRYLSEKNESGVWNRIVSECGNDNIAALLDAELAKVLPIFDGIKNPYEKMYSESNLPTRTIKELVCLIDEIDINSNKNNIDYLGVIYEYFIGNFAATEGNRGGEFFTPSSVVELLVQMLNPTSGTVYDPACGTGGMFIQSNKYCGKKLKFVGQEQNYKTIMLAYMNGVLHGLDLQIKHGDTLLNDLLPKLKADYVISNPPFNMKDWGADQLGANDPRVFGMINKNNANYMWIQHFIYHLKKTGKAGFVISNGALTSSNEADLFTRKKMIEDNLVDCVVQLPEKMFLGTAIPSALIFVSKDRKDNDKILFIDASELGESVSKTQKVLLSEDIQKIVGLYNSFKAGKKVKYNNKGFSWVATNADVLDNDCKLMPSIFTGVEEVVVDKKINEKKISELKGKLLKQIDSSDSIAKKLREELA
ncbi:MAG: type I restriction-modification system subunit M [Lachnospiraceae bacterium]|nr:type I restriction-modification system subunit M [Lachnospiraceae bacterium]